MACCGYSFTIERNPHYACKGEVSRRYLLRESKTNATLKLTTHLTHLPSSACAPAASPSSAPTTSTSTNTFTPPPLPKGEILTGISNILCSPSSPGIIGEHDVYRVRPKGLDLYGPYYDQEELEFDLLGGRAVSSNSSKTKKGKGKGDENEEKLEKDLTTPSAPPRRGRERAPTQSFDPSRLPLAYGPKTTETLIEVLFNPVRTTHEARESPFTVYVPPEPRGAAHEIAVFEAGHVIERVAFSHHVRGIRTSTEIVPDSMKRVWPDGEPELNIAEAPQAGGSWGERPSGKAPQAQGGFGGNARALRPPPQ
ncbi:hypothetical protein FPV67DRAFT_1703379 [Lyophyllum atratum]|nr:hypothetical protein FPV67DRAFT_1703379 [Lyophyllum atratum]